MVEGVIDEYNPNIGKDFDRYVIICCSVIFLDSKVHLEYLFICNLGHVWIPLDVILVVCTLSIYPLETLHNSV